MPEVAIQPRRHSGRYPTSAEFFGNKTAGHFDNMLIGALGGDPYRENICMSARRLIDKRGAAAKDWRYMTQYSSGKCYWASRNESEWELL